MILPPLVFPVRSLYLIDLIGSRSDLQARNVLVELGGWIEKQKLDHLFGVLSRTDVTNFLQLVQILQNFLHP